MLTIDITVDIALDKSTVIINPQDPEHTEIFEGNVKGLQKFLRKFKITETTERPNLGGTVYDK